jgi:hypothetical protein
MNARSFLLIPAVLALTACGTVVNQAQIDGTLYTRVHMNRYPVVVSAVDGQSTPTWRPMWVEPGRRTLSVDAPPARGFTLPVRKEIAFDVKPCTRYYFGAQRTNALTNAWEFVVDHEEPISACGVGTKTGQNSLFQQHAPRVAQHS